MQRSERVMLNLPINSWKRRALTFRHFHFPPSWKICGFDDQYLPYSDTVPVIILSYCWDCYIISFSCLRYHYGSSANDHLVLQNWPSAWHWSTFDIGLRFCFELVVSRLYKASLFHESVAVNKAKTTLIAIFLFTGNLFVGHRDDL